jgi:hypothetical protein
LETPDVQRIVHVCAVRREVMSAEHREVMGAEHREVMSFEF